MELLHRAVTLNSGLSIMLQAWPYTRFTANYLDFRALLKALREHAGFQEDGELPQQALIDRVVLASVPEGKDREALQVADLPELLEEISELNRLMAMAVKPLSLYTRLLQAEMDSLEAPTPPSTLPT